MGRSLFIGRSIKYFGACAEVLELPRPTLDLIDQSMNIVSSVMSMDMAQAMGTVNIPRTFYASRLEFCQSYVKQHL